MNENTKIMFYLEDPRSNEYLREETRTLKEWTGLTDEGMKGWSILHLERVLEQSRKNWAEAQVLSGWKVQKGLED
jgi:hypothetical protein